MDRTSYGKDSSTNGNGMNSIETTTAMRLEVSPSSVPARTEVDERRWYYMRVSYGREDRVNEYLLSHGIDTFLPKQRKVVTVRGLREVREVSLIPNSLFVFSTEAVLKQYIGKAPIPYFHHFYMPDKDGDGNLVGSGRKPLLIPDRQMENFMKWCHAESENKLLVNTVFIFKDQDLVRVTGGPFAGFTGHVVRYKGQSRVGVNINGVGFITTAYIPKHYLEKL